MKDESGEGGPGVFVGVEVGDFFVHTRPGACFGCNLYSDGTNAVVAFEQLAVSEGHRVGMGTGDAFEGILVEFVAAADDGMAEVLPDGGGAIEGADDNAESKDGEDKKEVPTGKDGEEMEGVEDGSEGPIAWEGVLLEPGSIAGGVVEDFAGGLNEIDAEQADNSDGCDEQYGGANGTKPAPDGVDGMAENVGESLLEATTWFIRSAFECPGTCTGGRA